MINKVEKLIFKWFVEKQGITFTGIGPVTLRVLALLIQPG